MTYLHLWLPSAAGSSLNLEAAPKQNTEVIYCCVHSMSVFNTSLERSRKLQLTAAEQPFTNMRGEEYYKYVNIKLQTTLIIGQGIGKDFTI